DAGAEVGAAFNENIAEPIGGLVAELENLQDFELIETEIRDFFWAQIGPGGAGLLLNADDVIAADGSANVPTPDHVKVRTLCGDDAHACGSEEEDGFEDLVDIQVEFKMGQVAEAATPRFDFGVPGLRLSGGGGTVASTVSWQLNVGFGIGL